MHVQLVSGVVLLLLVLFVVAQYKLWSASLVRINTCISDAFLDNKLQTCVMSFWKQASVFEPAVS